MSNSFPPRWHEDFVWWFSVTVRKQHTSFSPPNTRFRLNVFWHGGLRFLNTFEFPRKTFASSTRTRSIGCGSITPVMTFTSILPVLPNTTLCFESRHTTNKNRVNNVSGTIHNKYKNPRDRVFFAILYLNSDVSLFNANLHAVQWFSFLF